MDSSRRKKDAEKAGQAINKIIGVGAEAKKAETKASMLSRPSKTSTTKPDLPLKLPSSVCREKVNSSDLDLAKMFPSTVGGSQLFIAQERAENTRASASLKELRRFKSSRLDLRTHSHANTPYGTGVPKISRLHSVCTDSTHSPITTRTKSRQQTQHDLDIELENYAESTASVDTIEGATLDPIEHGHSEPPRNDTMDPSDSIAYPTLRGVQQLARQIRATSRVFLNANELLPNHSNARPASAPAADPPAIDEANSHPTPVTSSLQPHPPARGHSAAGFSQASTGRLISSGHARGGRAMRKATADSLVDIEKELGVVLVCHKLKSDPHAPNGRHLIASDSIRQHFKSGGRDDASGFDGHTNENTTELNDSSWFGDGEDGQASSDNFAIAEEDEEELEQQHDIQTEMQKNNGFNLCNDLLEEDEGDLADELQPDNAHQDLRLKSRISQEKETIHGTKPPAVEESVKFKCIAEVDDVLAKYNLLWKQRAKLLRNEPPSPESERCDFEETAETKTESHSSRAAGEHQTNVPSAREQPKSAISRSTKSSGSAKSGKSLVSFKESGSSRTGASSAKSNTLDLSLGPSAKSEEGLYIGKMHNQSEDLLVSANFGMESMIITSLQRLSENKKRKSTYEAVSRRSSAKRRQEESDSSVRPDIQIPGSKMDSTDDNADRGDEELPFPPFARLATPENFVHSFTGHPVAFHLPSAKKQEPARHIPMVLEDWYLDENGYTKKAKEIANWDDIVEARGPPVPIIKPKPPVPGLTPHSSHHHTHYPAFLEDSDEVLVREVAFSCKPETPIKYTEVIEAESRFQIRKNRPNYVASKDSLLSRLTDNLVGQGTSRKSNVETESSNGDSEIQSVSLSIKGKSVHIVSLDIGAGSVGLGMDWTPAPPKMSLPLKVYHHSHSMPETPRTRSRQQPVETDTEMSNDAILDTDEADDEGMNFQDMIQNEVVAAVIKPVRLSSRGRTPLVDILLEDPTLESMAFNEDEWVKSDAIVVPDIIESDHQESARTSFDISVIPGVIQEENIVEQDVTAPTANISINIVNSVVVTSDNKMQQTLSSPLDIDQPVQVDESKRVDVPKNPRQFLSDNEASAKKSAPIVVKHNRSHSQPPTQKKKKKVLVSAPVTIVKKKQKKSRVVSASSESSDPVDEMVSGIGESNLSINMVPLRSRSVSVSQDGHTPVSFYKKRRMSQTNQSVATLLSSEFSLSNGTGGNSMLTSTSSFMRSVASSYMSISGKKEAENDKAKKDVEKTLYSEPVGPNWYDLVHPADKRLKLFTASERAKYPTFTDAGPLDELIQIEGDQSYDPVGEIEKLTSLILSSNLPIPAFLRRRGILLGRVGRYEESMADLMKAIQFDPFHSEALWHRHQLYLRYGDTEKALKDLDAITDTNKLHFGAFLAKARIYEELTSEERLSGLPLEPATLGLIKVAIVNYSQIIRLKPDDAEGYYHRACLFEAENEMVYANEDFRMVRQLDPTNEHAIHNLAVYSFQRQLWDDAIQAFTKLIKLNPENGQAYLYRGRANAYLAKWDEALRDLTLAIQLAPDRADVFFYRGCLLRERNRRKAIEDLSISVLLDDTPTNTDAFYQRAMLYYKLKKYELALIDYHTVVELDPTKAAAWLNLGIIYMRFFNEHYRALDCFDKSIQHDPIQIRSFLCRGDLLQILHSDYSDEFSGNDKKNKKKTNAINILSFMDRAIRDYSKAIHLCPSDYLLYLFRGRLLLKQGKMKEATYDFYSAFELNPGIAQTFMQRAMVLSFQRKYVQIIEEFNQRIKLEKIEDASLYILVARARIKCDDNEGAIRDLAKALEFSRIKDPQIYLQKGICYENIKEWGNAIAEFTKCITLDTQFSKAYYHRGVCKLHEGNGKGVQDLDIALKLDPRFFEAYLSRASYNHTKGQFTEGIEDCNNALKLEPTSIRAHLLRGACNCKIHQYGLAIVDFTKAIHLDKTCHFAFYNRAVTYQLLEDYKNAIKDYSIVLLLCDDSNAYRNRGLIYWKQGDAENALLDLYAARDNFPGDARLHGLLALCLQKVGRTDESLQAFSSSIRVNQTMIEAYLGRGNVYASIGQTKEAKHDYARVLHLYPTCTEAYVNMAYASQMEGRHQRAWDLFERAIAVNPNCTPALEGRAVVNYMMNNFFGALMDICKAIDISPNNAEYFTNRAVIYSALNDNVKALQDNKYAIKLEPHYALAYFNTANLYFAQSRWEVALEYYNKALEFDQDDYAAILNRGITKAQLNDTAGALDDLNVAQLLNPTSAEVHFNRAQLFQKIGLYENADEDYSMVLELCPVDSMAYKRRGEVRGKQGRINDSMQDHARNIIFNG